ncbi:gamma-glutamyltranspeptidase periplasmic precursor [Penicillium canescens]|nr:gamma-glutamyltranspeptidase periplasmic precursor [Penicillium canescens]
MTGPEKSHLSGREGGYDFVIATTQSSVNAGLKEFLDKVDQPTTTFCIIQNSRGEIAEAITLDELKERSNGVDPFAIKDGTDVADERIQTLAQVCFAGGFRFQQGIPNSVMPKDAPDVVELGDDVTKVKFRLMCREFEIVVHQAGVSWQLLKQSDRVDGKSQQWLFESSVDIVRANLPKNLDTPYFDKHPEEKQRILDAINNLSGTAFNLQQLMFDLDSTVVQEIPEIKGIAPGSIAHEALDKYFKDYYVATAREHGWPLLGINAVAQKSDPSTVMMTDYERQVTAHTNPVFSTLDNVCMTDNNPLPPAYTFDWNWVKEVDPVKDAPHGVLAINRRHLTKMFSEELVRQAKWLCCKFAILFTSPPTVVFVTGEEPTVTTHETGDTLFELDYHTYEEDIRGDGGGIASQDFKSSLSVDGNTLIHHYKSEFNITCIKNGERYIYTASPEVTQSFSLTVDAGGSLQLKAEWPVIGGEEAYFDPRMPQEFPNLLYTMLGIMTVTISGMILNAQAFAQLQKTIFPGSRVFVYTNARFSDYHDLICDLRYLAPENSGKKSPLEAATGLTITYSSELMENFLHTETVKKLPSGHFEALQTDIENGHALVFSIGSDHSLYAWEECSGLTATGWKRHDLSLMTMQMHFAGQEDAVVRTFAVGQSPLDGSIGMAMVVEADGTDILHVSLGNSSSDTAWLNGPRWSAVPFDGVGERPQRIEKVMFSETSYNVQYLMVDIDTGIPGHQIVRYHIDLDKQEGKVWMKHDIPIDLDPKKYQSVVGRKHGDRVDGVYTAGSISGRPQLVYEPIVNVYGDGAPTVTRLALPGRELPSAIATVRYADSSSRLYGATDLYLISGATLYRYPADKQTTDAEGETILNDPIFIGTSSLHAMELDGVVTLWGLNYKGEVYYISCYVDEVNDAASWSCPMPLLTDTERISPYVNRTDGGNTIFAYTEDRLLAITQATATESKMWKTSYIQVEPTPKPEPEPCDSFVSYTTTITLRDAHDNPVPETMLSLQAESRTHAYVNGKYYILGWHETLVPTDLNGLVTVVEASEDAAGAILHVSLPQDNEAIVINTMDKTFDKCSSLDTEDGIRAATYPAIEVMGGVMDDERVPLVDPDTEQEDVKRAAESMSNLKEKYPEVKPSAKRSKLFYKQHRAPRVVRRGPGEQVPGKNVWSLWSAIGDVFKWLTKAVKKAVEVVWDSAKKAWKFVADIAGKVYNAVLDAVDAIVGAVVWVFNAIKTAIEAIIRFLKFLFQWKDIKRTKQVLHRVVKLFLTHQVDQIDTVRATFRDNLDGAAEKIREWGGVSDWSSMGDTAKLPPNNSGEDPSKDHDSTSLLFSNHFRGQAEKIQVQGALPEATTTEAQDLIDVLLDAIRDEGEVLSTVYEDLQDVAKRFASLSVGEIIKRIAAILGSALVSSVRVVVDALFGVLSSLADSALNLLDAKLHIPVISDILNAIGIPDISFLDLFCWIGAVGCTVVYKVVYGEAPFPDTSAVKDMISARSWSDLQRAVNSKRALEIEGSSGSGGGKTPDRDLEYWERVIHSVGHGFSGFILWVNTFVKGAEALASSTKGSNPMSIIATVLGITVAGSQAGAAALAPRHPVEAGLVNGLSTATTVVSIGVDLIFWGPVLNRLAVPGSWFRGLVGEDGRATAAIIKSILVLPQLYVTGWHFYELGQKNAGAERSAAIIGEVTNLAAYTATISYAVAVNSGPAPTPPKLAAIAVMTGANITAGGLQTARAALPN